MALSCFLGSFFVVVALLISFLFTADECVCVVVLVAVGGGGGMWTFNFYTNTSG